MKYGIDSYCYHRFFGEVYEGQEAPKKQMTVSELLERTKQMGAEGISLETCFLPSDEDAYFTDLGAELDRYDFYRVLAWGHPTGLERGQKPEALDELIRYIPKAKRMGADVMRITASCYLWRFENHQQQIEAIMPLLKKAVKAAEDNGLNLAMETHTDFTAPEMKTIIDRIGSPNFGVTFDSGNLIRMLQDPVAGMELLAPYVFATHIKDVVVDTTFSAAHHCFFSSVPVGWGIVDTAKLAEILGRHNYEGMLAVEIDQLARQWAGLEDEAVAISVHELRKLAKKFS